VYILLFSVGKLRQLAHMTPLRLVQLVDCSGAPWDFRVAGDPRTYADLITPQGLKFVDRYADGIGACKDTRAVLHMLWKYLHLAAGAGVAVVASDGAVGTMVEEPDGSGPSPKSSCAPM
jgi:glycerophosphoryl diester phosphodiesterase